MYRIGLTGGVGSGKSTVSSYMKELGIPVIDGDKLAQEAVRPGSSAMMQLREVFGGDIFNEDGTLNRQRMADVAFRDERKIQQLNAIIHPYVWERVQEQLLSCQQKGNPIVVLDMPLLLEISWHLRVEEVWVVVVPEETQVQRVMERNGFTREQVLERIQNQMPTVSKEKYADVIIDNSCSISDTKRQVRNALHRIPGFIFLGEQDGQKNENAEADRDTSVE